MDEELIQKVKEALNARVSNPAPNIYNIVVPITEHQVDALINLLLTILNNR